MAMLARTIAEARLYMDLQPCDACGYLGFTGSMATARAVARFSGQCPRCKTVRQFTFRLPDRTYPGFGGADPSELLDPGEWLVVADLAARHAPVPDAADYALAAAAVDEVLKFIPSGGDAVPPEALHTATGRAAYELEPGRFHKTRLAAVADTYRRHLP
jgi:phage FluMu protein Com